MGKKRIVILGGGFAGIYTALYLEKFLKIQKDEFIFHLMMNIDEKVRNYPFYYNQALLI